MLKNVFKASSSISCSRKDSLECSLCKNSSCKTIVYVCSSGHIICGNCQNIDNKQDCGDNAKCRAEKIYSSTPKIKSPDLNFACGDHVKLVKSEYVSHKHEKKSSKNFRKVNVIEYDNKDKNLLLQNKEITVEFKNLNYQDSSSGSDSCLNNNIDNVLQRCKITARPIICPISQCSKMVALDSISLHFYFDHSKIPRITLNHTEAWKINLKATNFTTETECIGIILNQKEKQPNSLCHENKATRIEVSQDIETDNILLLMMAKMIPNIKTKSKTKAIFTRNNSTQTEAVEITKINTPDTRVARFKDINKINSTVHEYEFSNDDILMIWLCKFDDHNTIYSITLSREDNRLSYTYTGEASHIRNKQDASSIYKRSDCLQIKGIAVNRCLNSTNQIQVYIKAV